MKFYYFFILLLTLLFGNSIYAISNLDSTLYNESKYYLSDNIYENRYFITTGGNITLNKNTQAISVSGGYQFNKVSIFLYYSTNLYKSIYNKNFFNVNLQYTFYSFQDKLYPYIGYGIGFNTESNNHIGNIFFSNIISIGAQYNLTNQYKIILGFNTVLSNGKVSTTSHLDYYFHIGIQYYISFFKS